jgi:hypothetical protein
MNLKSDLRGICSLSDGVDLIGVAPSERFLDLPENKRPTMFLPKTKSVIVIGSQLFEVLTKKLYLCKLIYEESSILPSVCSIFQQDFDKVYFWYHGVFQLRNTPPSDNYH